MRSASPRRFLLALLVFLIAFAALAAEAKPAKPRKSADFVEPLNHDVSIITPKNFDSSIEKYRDRFPGAVMYYARRPEARKFINSVWDPVAKKLKGMARIGAVDCEEHADFCKKHDISVGEENPFSVKLFPPLPQPARLLDNDAKLQDIAKLASMLSHLIPPGKITQIKAEPELTAFVGDHAALPKVLLFTDKKKAGPMFNALAHTFSDRMNFAMVGGTLSDGLFKKFHVKKTPTLILKKGDVTLSVKGSQTYRGELNFHALHEWLNVHSETFVKGGGFLTEKEPEAQNITDVRPWLMHKVPEINKASHHDVCFKKGKGLCAIYLTPNEEISAEEKAMLEEMADIYNPETRPGFYWSWMNVAREVNFAKLFNIDLESESQPQASLAVFNPHSRLRFSKLPAEEVADKASMSRFIDKIVSGDGRFTIVKGNRVPAFAQKPRKKTQSEEL